MNKSYKIAVVSVGLLIMACNASELDRKKEVDSEEIDPAKLKYLENYFGPPGPNVHVIYAITNQKVKLLESLLTPELYRNFCDLREHKKELAQAEGETQDKLRSAHIKRGNFCQCLLKYTLSTYNPKIIVPVIKFLMENLKTSEPIDCPHWITLQDENSWHEPHDSFYNIITNAVNNTRYRFPPTPELGNLSLWIATQLLAAGKKPAYCHVVNALEENGFARRLGWPEAAISYDIVQLLLKAKAPLYIQRISVHSGKDLTTLDALATARIHECSPEIIKLLEEYQKHELYIIKGATPDSPESDQRLTDHVWSNLGELSNNLTAKKIITSYLGLHPSATIRREAWHVCQWTVNAFGSRSLY